MATIQYICDACDARFKVETRDLAREGLVLMCPECAETELLRVADLSVGCCEAIPGTNVYG